MVTHEPRNIDVDSHSPITPGDEHNAACENRSFERRRTRKLPRLFLFLHSRSTYSMHFYNGIGYSRAAKKSALGEISLLKATETRGALVLQHLTLLEEEKMVYTGDFSLPFLCP
ncbi:hypothetical protein CEXT_88561 [Caerostris extrusa]|uniref:Uncharacterized protein n=1 Tax=Caerostris extrusa TaxID=172846 RepID=A0AAV4WUM8_CAEEX|nr:hypothetical protein CEXT_88561 [Caerostris extrusa]